MISLTSGKPIKASCIGGFTEILRDGVNTFLIKPGDVDSLANSLARVLRDDRLRGKIGREIKKLAIAELSWHSVANKTIAVYEHVLKKREYNLEDVFR